MRTLVSLAVLTVSLVQGAPLTAQSTNRLREDLDFTRQKVYPTLVNIGVVVKYYSGGREERFPAAGSGVIVSPAGHVVTNFHVTEKAERINCTLSSGESIAADLVAEDPPTDLAVLKLRLNERKNATRALPFATLGDSDVLRVGDYVVAVGNPLALSSSMTLGIVSNARRVFTDFTGTSAEDLDFGGGNKTGMFTQWIQHDALILPGNSGGPLVNLKGEIVGINTRGGSGVGFATPSRLVSHVLSQILAYGEVRRGWLGVSVVPVAKLGRKDGVLVSGVTPESPAAKAGIEPGDIILAVGQEPTTALYFEQIPRFLQTIAELSAGDNVKVSFLRDGEAKKVDVAVGAMEDYVGKQTVIRKLGVVVQDITGPMARARRFPNRDGVVVSSLRPGRPLESAKPRVLPRDIVLKLNGEKVTDIKSFTKILDAAGDAEVLTVGVRRGREHIVSVIKIDESEKKKSGGELAKAWVGIKTQVVTPEVAKSLGVEGTKGLRVTRVYAETEAEKAGLEAGDIIVAFDDEALESYREQDAKDLESLVEEYGVDEEVTMEVVRAGEKKELPIKLQRTPAPASEAKKSRDEFLELGVREVMFSDRIQRDWENSVTGVIVTESTRGGWANIGGLRIGDLILRIGKHAVTDVDSFGEAMEALKKERPATALVFVRRGIRTAFVFLEPGWEDLDDSEEQGAEKESAEAADDKATEKAEDGDAKKL